MSTDNLFIAISNLIPNQDCDSQVLADVIRAEIDARIREALVSKWRTITLDKPISIDDVIAGATNPNLKP